VGEGGREGDILLIEECLTESIDSLLKRSHLGPML
jgi:hypothetical protein